MRLTVIIPTYNRGELLGRALRGMLEQTLAPKDYEIIVVDDGSTDSTPRVVAEVGAPAARLRYFRQKNAGPATARNYGVREAKGEIVLFTGDDCLPDPKLLEEHLRAHDAEGDVGVLGHIAWHPEVEVTPFMSFLEEGVQFGFMHIADPENVPYWAFYTSNCSVRKRRLEEAGGFDEEFRHAAWEDIELAYRLHQRGMRLVYRPAALTYHHHATTLERYLTRQRIAGRSAVLFYRKHPELAEQIGILHAANPQSGKDLYGGLVAYAFSLGVREGLRTDGAPVQDETAVLAENPRALEECRGWIHEVYGGDDPLRKDLERAQQELREVRPQVWALQQELRSITSRRLYRWSSALAQAGWRGLRALGLARLLRRK